MRPVEVTVGGERREIAVAARWILWHITRRCNITCDYCYGSFSGQSYKQQGRDPDELSLDRCVRLFFELADGGFDGVHINGGEPLTRPDVESILRQARSAVIEKWLLTNGTIRGRIFDAISTDGLVDLLAISLDSNVAAVNEAGRERTVDAIRSLELLAERKRAGTLTCLFGVYIVLTRHSVATLPSYLRWLRDLNVDYVNMQPAFLPEGHPAAVMTVDAADAMVVRRSYDQLNDGLRGSGDGMQWLALRTLDRSTGAAHECFADRGDYFYVSPSGLVYGCPVKAAPSSIAVGNLHRHSMADIAARLRPPTTCRSLCGDCLGMYEMASGPRAVKLQGPA